MDSRPAEGDFEVVVDYGLNVSHVKHTKEENILLGGVNKSLAC